MKQQLIISTTEELKDFVNRADIGIKSAFEVTQTFLNISDNDNDENLSVCISIILVGGNNEPNFTKNDIIKWIDDYDKDPLNCVATFSFR